MNSYFRIWWLSFAFLLAFQMAFAAFSNVVWDASTPAVVVLVMLPLMGAWIREAKLFIKDRSRLKFQLGKRPRIGTLAFLLAVASLAACPLFLLLGNRLWADAAITVAYCFFGIGVVAEVFESKFTK